MTAPPEFSGYRAPHSEHPYRAHPFEPPKQQGPCLSCHREGHLAQNCPTWKGRCYRCHKEGHVSNTCTLPDKRRKRPAATNQPTKTNTNENPELARALAYINKELREIKARLQPNWAWRTLPRFGERKAKITPQPKPPEELGVTKPQIELPQEIEIHQETPKDLRTDLQGCDPPLHMHIGENMMTVSRLPPVPAWCVSAKTWHTLTPAECRQSEADYENSNNKKYDDGMILHTRDNTWLLKNFPKNPNTDPFAGAVASLYAMHFHDNMWLPGRGHIQQHPQAEQHNAAPPSDDDADEPSPTLVPQQRDKEHDNDGYDDGYDSDLWRPDCGPTVLHDYCPTGTDPFLLAVARASTAEENTRSAEPKPPTGQQQSSAKHNGHTKQKEQHAKQRRRKK